MRPSLLATLLITWLSLVLPAEVGAGDSVWVQTGVTGRLIYTPDAQGDRVLDFSSVGYRGQGVDALPASVPTAVSVSPVPGDDTAAIQEAINAVSSLPLGPDGYRGAVELSAGHYDIESQLEIRASGVVLRGAGQGESGTVLHGRNTGPNGTNQRPLIRVYGSGGLSNSGSRRNVIDKVVPVGATSFRVDVPSTFQAGDTVRVIRATDDPWVSDLGMDMIPPRSDGGTVNQWTETTINQRFDRVVTRVEGDRVFVDAPIPAAIDQQYGGATIQKYNWSGAIENVGIEGIRGEADFDSDTDEDHAWEFISVGISHVSSRAQNVWVRDIHGKHFGDSLVVANPGSKWVTVANAVHEEPKSLVAGGRRYTYDLSGELGLVTNATADSGRHDFVNNSTAPKGPNVFHNSTATNALSDTGPHQRWATGTLFDNITVQGDGINARNRGNFGSGHGWSGANMVVWNSTADSFIVQNPPTAQNWLIGSTGTILNDTRFGPQPPGNYDSHGSPVTVGGETSLYDAQRNDARDVESFEWAGGVGSWEDALGWRQSLTPGVYSVSQRDYLIGDIDDYTNDGPGSVDEPTIDSAWLSAINGSSGLPVVGLDTTTGNANVAFTIQHELAPFERVVHASLALAMRESGGVVDSDFLRLFDFDPANRFSLSDLGWASQLGPNESFVGVVDLGLHLDQLQSGSVNVQLNDDTAVDWAMYVATVATPIAGAETANVTIGQGEAIVDSSLGNVGSLAVGGPAGGALRLESGGALIAIEAYTQQAGGALRIEIDQTGSGQLFVAGDATIGGELELLMGEGWTPDGGDQFTLVTAAGPIAGAFDEITLPQLDDGLRWMVTQDSTMVIASVGLAADFNGDGVVDAADFTVWRDSFGSTTDLSADADGDGVIGVGDHAIWRDSFGLTLAASSVVPEPTPLGLAIGGLFLRWPNRRNRSKHLPRPTR
ncbi:MAG: hypothetical protein AAGJ46_08535 [Planctomycetota bacterium]